MISLSLNIFQNLDRHLQLEGNQWLQRVMSVQLNSVLGAGCPQTSGPTSLAILRSLGPDRDSPRCVWPGPGSGLRERERERDNASGSGGSESLGWGAIPAWVEQAGVTTQLFEHDRGLGVSC